MIGRKFSQVILIEFVAIFQGLAFGIVPSLMALITNPDFHNLSRGEFFILFIPFALAAILLAVMAGWFSQRRKLHHIFIGGMVLNFVALFLIALTGLSFSSPRFTFALLFVALFFLGGGVSCVMMVLSRWMSAIFHNMPFGGILLLWVTGGFGMLLSVGLIEYVLLLHKWWLAPGLVLGVLFVLLLMIDLFDNYPKIPKKK